MTAAMPLETSAHIRLEMRGRIAVAGKYVRVAGVEAWIELFVECSSDPERLFGAVTEFASLKRGHVHRLRDTWHVPLLRITLPLGKRRDAIAFFLRTAESLFQSLKTATR